MQAKQAVGATAKCVDETRTIPSIRRAAASSLPRCNFLINCAICQNENASRADAGQATQLTCLGASKPGRRRCRYTPLWFCGKINEAHVDNYRRQRRSRELQMVPVALWAVANASRP